MAEYEYEIMGCKFTKGFPPQQARAIALSRRERIDASLAAAPLGGTEVEHVASIGDFLAAISNDRHLWRTKEVDAVLVMSPGMQQQIRHEFCFGPSDPNMTVKTLCGFNMRLNRHYAADRVGLGVFGDDEIFTLHKVYVVGDPPSRGGTEDKSGHEKRKAVRDE